MDEQCECEKRRDLIISAQNEWRKWQNRLRLLSGGGHHA